MGPVITTYRSNMADAAPADRGGFRGGFGGRGRGRGRGRGGRGGRGRGRGKEEKEWVPITKLGRFQGWKDQVPSRDLPVFSSHQRVRNYRLLYWTCIERRSSENYASPNTNSCRSKNSLQGIRCNWRLQWPCRSWS